MTSDVRELRSLESASAGCVPRADNDAPAIEALQRQATLVRARRRQNMPAHPDRDERVYLVKAGVLLMHTTPPGKPREVLSVLYPGDVFTAALAPPSLASGLVALTSAELLRFQPGVMYGASRQSDAIAAMLWQRLTRQTARLGLHAAMIGSLTGEERVASFLFELCLRLGGPTPRGIAFDMPLARSDTADYLALNADTLSRIMSRFKERGLIKRATRSRIECCDVPALRGESSMAAAIEKLNQRIGAPAAE